VIRAPRQAAGGAEAGPDGSLSPVLTGETFNTTLRGDASMVSTGKMPSVAAPSPDTAVAAHILNCPVVRWSQRTERGFMMNHTDRRDCSSAASAWSSLCFGAWKTATLSTFYTLRRVKRETVDGHDCSAFESGSCPAVWHSDFDFPAIFELFRGDLADSERTAGIRCDALTGGSIAEGGVRLQLTRQT
jgi:hypothetical protein